MQDFYAGYEGEPEYLFSVDDKVALRCWEGHIAAVFDDVPPERGAWAGLAEGWHFDGWGDQPWQPRDLRACLTQLQAIEEIPERYRTLAHEALCANNE